MPRRNTILLLATLALAGSGSACLAGEEVLVTAPPLTSSAAELGRVVEVIGRADMQNYGGSSAADALEYATMASVQERGGSSIQSDLSVRGGSFQQVLVTIDGLPAVNPQTSHHNMGLPFPRHAISRIYVISGPGSALFGPSAFAGTVDIVTTCPEKSGAWAEAAYGDFDTLRMEAGADYTAGKTANALSVMHEESNGFQDGTDYKVWSVWDSCVVGFDSWLLKIAAGHAVRDFGARDFYAPYDSREKTSVTHVDLRPELVFGPGWHLKSAVRYRRHEDEFVLQKDNPGSYRNEHDTDTFLERVTLATPEYCYGKSAVGVERSDAVLESSNLGGRDTFVNSVFIQHIRRNEDHWSMNVGLRSDYHEMWGTEVSPSAAFLHDINRFLSFRVSGGRAVRPPSFTELYYSDPANFGNVELEPEKAWGGEAGFDFFGEDGRKLMFTYFERRTRDLVDWVRTVSDEPWEARNIGSTDFRGGEMMFVSSQGMAGFRLNYRYMDVDSKISGLESKYALNYARHELGCALSMACAWGVSLSTAAKYRNVPNLDEYLLVSARLSRSVGRFEVFTQGKNLLDEEYSEIPDVPTAGRYLEGGIQVEW